MRNADGIKGRDERQAALDTVRVSPTTTQPSNYAKPDFLFVFRFWFWVGLSAGQK